MGDKNSKSEATSKDPLKELVLLSDAPLLEKDERDDFGHQYIANTIKDLIGRVTPPFVIGLFGGWGIGKTTIVNKLLDQLKTERKVRCIYFDVWKYDENTLRRQLLISSASQLNQKKKVKELKESFVYSRTKIDSALRIRKSLILIVMALVSFFGFSYLYWGLNTTRDIFFIFFGTASLSTLLGKLIVVDDIVFTKDKLSEPDEFEDQFKNIINNSGTKKKLFIFDNLDRVSHGNAVKLLSTIKSFLEFDDCIYLIPCDEEAIRRHVSSVYLKESNSADSATKYANEYLRKFFNAVVRVPSFEDIELDDYTKKLLEATKVKELEENPDLRWLITSTFRSNPREIKQFINSLAATLLLVKNRVESNDIVDEELQTKDIAFHAKLLVLRQQHPTFYREIEKAVLFNARTWSEIEEISSDSALKARKFLESTRAISPTVGLAFFFTLRQSVVEQQLPGWTQYVKHALDKNHDSTIEFLKSFVDADKLNEFDLLSSAYVKRFKDRNERTFPFMSSTLRAFNDTKTPITKDLAKEIFNVLPGKLKNVPIASDFPPSSVISVLEGSVGNRTDEKNLARGYINAIRTGDNLSSEDDLEAITDSVVKHEAFYKHEIENLAKRIKSTYTDAKHLRRFLGTDLEAKIIPPATLNSFADKMNKGELVADDLSTDLDLLRTWKGDWSDDLRVKIVKILREMTDSEKPSPIDRSEKQIILNFLVDFSSRNLAWLNKADPSLVQANVAEISNTLCSWYPQGSPAQKRAIFDASYTLNKLEGNPAEGNLKEQVIKPFVKEASHDEYSTLGAETLKEVSHLYTPELAEAVIKSDEVIQLTNKHINTKDKERLVAELIRRGNIDKAVMLLKDFKYKERDPSAVLGELFSQMSKFGDDLIADIFDLTYKFRSKISEHIKQEFYQQLTIKVEKAESDFGKKMIKKYVKKGGKYLFSQIQKEELLKHITKEDNE